MALAESTGLMSLLSLTVWQNQKSLVSMPVKWQSNVFQGLSDITHVKYLSHYVTQSVYSNVFLLLHPQMFPVFSSPCKVETICVHLHFDI